METYISYGATAFVRILVALVAIPVILFVLCGIIEYINL